MTEKPFVILERSGGTKRCESIDTLYTSYQHLLVEIPQLSRKLISFQNSKKTPLLRWLRYKEAFSQELVHFYLSKYGGQRILDPFAGIGTVLTVAAQLDRSALGIEYLPIGPAAFQARKIASKIDPIGVCSQLDIMVKADFGSNTSISFPHNNLTQKAFPAETELLIGRYLHLVRQIKSPDIKSLFEFALMCVLEEVSYTRKDGQYLRWDHRSGRTNGSFEKKIRPFKEAIEAKLNQIKTDMHHRQVKFDGVEMMIGSVFDRLPTIPPESFDIIITSPPYCNRYDYTRTYALELAMFGKKDHEIKKMRQDLLSATVENKSKKAQLRKKYGNSLFFNSMIIAYESHSTLTEIRDFLHEERIAKNLNNSNIPFMVDNYFLEMCVVIFELGRILTPGGRVVMVNDNVRYAGQEIPVDLILSDFACAAGLVVDEIGVLPRGKGNSSQQMGKHGRQELRKCVYVWVKPEAENQRKS